MLNNTRTGALLHRDHVATIVTLQRLESFLTAHGPKRLPDVEDPSTRAVLTAAIKAIASEVDRHFAFEQDNLFPLLAERGESAIGEFLQSEHEVILPLAAGIAAIAEAALESGFNADTWRTFHSDGMELVEREIFHIQKEEMGLLAAISMLLSPEDDAALAARYEAVLAAA